MHLHRVHFHLPVSQQQLAHLAIGCLTADLLTHVIIKISQPLFCSGCQKTFIHGIKEKQRNAKLFLNALHCLKNVSALIHFQQKCLGPFLDLQKQIDRFIGNFLNRFINHIRKYRVIRQLDQKHIQFPGNRNDLLRNRLNKPSWLNRKSCDISFCKLAKQSDKFFQIIFKRK